MFFCVLMFFVSWCFCSDPDNVNILEAAVTPPGELWISGSLLSSSTSSLSLLSLSSLSSLSSSSPSRWTLSLQLEVFQRLLLSSQVCIVYIIYLVITSRTNQTLTIPVHEINWQIEIEIDRILNCTNQFQPETRSCFRVSWWRHFTRWARSCQNLTNPKAEENAISCQQFPRKQRFVILFSFWTKFLSISRPGTQQRQPVWLLVVI